MESLRLYLDFIFRPLSQSPTPNGFEVLDSFAILVTGWTLFFIAWYYVFAWIGAKVFPQWYQTLPERKRREFPVYAMCLVHHFVVVPRAWLHIVQDFFRSSSELSRIQYVFLEAPMVPFSFGYLLGDTLVYALPELFRIGTYDYLLHHLLSSWLLVNAMSSSGHMMRYTPHLIICDTTNILFNIAWLLRTSKTYRGSKIVMVLEMGFALLFLPTRVINLTLILWAAFNQPQALELGISRFAFIPILLLQYFWFYKILCGISSRLSASSEVVELSSDEKNPLKNHHIEDSHSLTRAKDKSKNE